MGNLQSRGLCSWLLGLADVILEGASMQGFLQLAKGPGLATLRLDTHLCLLMSQALLMLCRRDPV